MEHVGRFMIRDFFGGDLTAPAPPGSFAKPPLPAELLRVERAATRYLDDNLMMRAMTPPPPPGRRKVRRGRFGEFARRLDSEKPYYSASATMVRLEGLVVEFPGQTFDWTVCLRRWNWWTRWQLDHGWAYLPIVADPADAALAYLCHFGPVVTACFLNGVPAAELAEWWHREAGEEARRELVEALFDWTGEIGDTGWRACLAVCEKGQAAWPFKRNRLIRMWHPVDGADDVYANWAPEGWRSVYGKGEASVFGLHRNCVFDLDDVGELALFAPENEKCPHAHPYRSCNRHVTVRAGTAGRPLAVELENVDVAEGNDSIPPKVAAFLRERMPRRFWAISPTRLVAPADRLNVGCSCGSSPILGSLF